MSLKKYKQSLPDDIVEYNIIGGPETTFWQRQIGGLSILIFWGSLMVPLILITKIIQDIIFDSIYSPIQYLVPLLVMHILPFEENYQFAQFVLMQAQWFKGGVGQYFEKNVKDQPENKGLIQSFHPHSIIPYGFSLNGALRTKSKVKEYGLQSESENIQNAKGLCAPILFQVPIFSVFLKWLNTASSSDKKPFTKLLGKGTRIGITPGGMDEMSIYQQKKEILQLKNRKGFVKQALQYGTPICPVYTFGETDTQEPYQFFQQIGFQTKKQFGFNFVVCEGWTKLFPLSLLPKNDNGLHSVYGNPLILPKIENPTEDEVNQYHGLQMNKLKNLQNKYKQCFGQGSRELIIT